MLYLEKMGNLCKRLVFIFTFLWLLSTSVIGQNLRINEVMTSNSMSLDEDGDSPDWIELYNPGVDPVNLSGWHISDNIDKPKKWSFPDINIKADEYLFLWASGKDRSVNGSIRNFITQGDNFKYLIPNTNPANNWNTLSYNDSNWQEDSSGFGYADGDDETLLPNGTRSVYLRRTFDIKNVNELEELFLHIDYDDAFVAYINGVEVARENINGTPPNWNQTAITDHEASIYRDGVPDLFTLEDISSILLNGENVLAIQAHNVSSSSSDMTIIPFLSAQYNTQTNEGDPTPEILALRDKYLHTNFKLSATKETIYLFDANEELVDSMLCENIPPDISTGISASEDQVIFAIATPGEENGGDTFKGIVDQTISFSKEGGMVNTFDLELSGVEPSYTIRYTLDATEPDESSTVFDGSITISNTTVVRARVFKEGLIPSAIQSNVYRIGKSHTLPVIDLITEEKNLYDTNHGIYIRGLNAENSFPYFGANFWQDWERPVNFRFTKGETSYSFDGGMKIFGGWSRGNNQRSFSIFARSRYGTSEMNFPFFEKRDYNLFQSLVMRNSGNDWLVTMFRDGLITSLMDGSGVDVQAYEPTITYMNGEYWGIYNLREKINEHYVVSKQGGTTEDVTILERNGETIFGSNDEYLNLIEFVSSHNLSNEANYKQVEAQIDIENMITYQAAQIYFNNTDWPGNNIKFFKTKGGKWRWILFDTDFGLNIWNSDGTNNNTLAFALETNGPDWPNPPWSTLLFRKLMDNQEYRHKFINRFADMMNSRFRHSNISNQINKLSGAIQSEITDHFERWGGDASSWNNSIQRMRDFSSRRSSIVKNHITKQFSLPNYHNISVSNPKPTFGFVRLNSLVIADGYWQGDYFETVPIQLIAIPNEGYRFSHWEGVSTSTDQEISISLAKGSIITPVFVEDTDALLDMMINEINYSSSDDHDTGDWIEIYNPSNSTKDISNWEIKDSDDEHSYLMPEGTLIENKGYLVITRDQEKFKELHPEVINFVGDMNFGLSSSEDGVRLYDPNGVLKDSVRYSADSPWPTGAAGLGYTLELSEPGLDNSIPDSWANIHEHGSPGKTNLKSTSTSDIIDQLSISLSPNPTSGELSIQFTTLNNTQLQINILDINGKLVKNISKHKFRAGKQSIETDVYNIPSGVYFLSIHSEQNAGVETIRFLKY